LIPTGLLRAPWDMRDRHTSGERSHSQHSTGWTCWNSLSATGPSLSYCTSQQRATVRLGQPVIQLEALAAPLVCFCMLRCAAEPEFVKELAAQRCPRVRRSLGVIRILADRFIEVLERLLYPSSVRRFQTIASCSTIHMRQDDRSAPVPRGPPELASVISYRLGEAAATSSCNARTPPRSRSITVGPDVRLITDPD